MKHWALSLVLLLSMSAFAQTYTQTAESACPPGGYVCNGIPLDDGHGNKSANTGSFVAPYGYFQNGQEVTILINGVEHFGISYDNNTGITDVITQPPRPGCSAPPNQPFSFEFVTTDGWSGKVSGIVTPAPRVYRSCAMLVVSSTWEIT